MLLSMGSPSQLSTIPFHFHHFHQAKEKQKVDSFVTLAEQHATTAISGADAGTTDAGSAEDGHGSALSFLELREEPEPESLLNVLAEGVAKVVGKYGKD